MSSNKNIQFLAYYLPQYHPIPENDKWWGKGFTEWTNVAKAKPLFKGHYQPRLPTDLGYYDLRLPEVREHQAQLAKEYGVDGFCYYHYWFGNGKMVLERPLQEVIKFKSPDFPFCLCWANETWKGIWFGGDSNQTLLEQKYPGRQDYIDHFNYLLEAFKDERYIKIDGKCLFSVYIPDAIPDLELFLTTFRQCARDAGLGDLYILATRCPDEWDPILHGFDGGIGVSQFTNLRYVTAPLYQKRSSLQRIKRKIKNIFLGKGHVNLNFESRQKPLIVEYKEAIKYLLPPKKYDYDFYPCVINDWDNTARSGNKGVVLNNSTPALWEKHLTEACQYVAENKSGNKVVFLKSWNEWAEGNYLEPDAKWGHQYLEVLRNVKEKFNTVKQQ
jgi:hypothetical protein